MPSRERPESINLHRVSPGVGKFSAELDLVDSCNSTRAADNHFLSRIRLETISQSPSHSPSRSFTNPRSSSSARRVFAALSPPGLSAKLDGDKKGHTFSPSCPAPV